MVLAHDDDLVTIDGLGHDAVSGLLSSSYIVSCCQSLEALEPDAMMDFLRRSNIEIHKVLCGEIPVLIESQIRCSQLPSSKICPQLIVVQTPILLLSM